MKFILPLIFALFLSAFALSLPAFLPFEASAQNDISDRGFVGANGCIPTESEVSDFIREFGIGEYLDDVPESESAKYYINGILSANVVRGNKAFFEGNQISFSTQRLFSTQISTKESRGLTNFSGFFKIPVSTPEGVFTSHLRSSKISAFNDDSSAPVPNVSCYIVNGLNNCFDKTNITSRYDLSVARQYDVFFNSVDISDVSTINAYYHALKAEQWATQKELWQGTKISVRANFFPFCNAQFFPVIDWILLGQESTWTVNNQTVPCANTAYSTIIQHEYGHAFLNSIIGYPIPINVQDPNAYHEGIADAFSSFSLNTPCLGEDLFGTGSGCFRNMEDDFVYPVNSNDVYNRSRPLSGAFWDMREQIIKEKGYEKGSDVAHTLFIETIKSHDSGLNPSIRDVLLEKDTLYFKSEHHKIINETFSAHGL